METVIQQNFNGEMTLAFFAAEFKIFVPFIFPFFHLKHTFYHVYKKHKWTNAIKSFSCTQYFIFCFFTIHCILSSVSGCIGTVLHFLRLHREKLLHYSAFGGKTFYKRNVVEFIKTKVPIIFYFNT